MKSLPLLLLCQFPLYGMEPKQLTDKAVEIYFRGNAHSLRPLILPMVQRRIEHVTSDPELKPVAHELLKLSKNKAELLPDCIHKMVSEAVEEAIKQREDRLSIEHKQRNAAVATAALTTLTAIIALVTHLV